jgi:RNA polymerase sigma factor (sigma-70 family)
MSASPPVVAPPPIGLPAFALARLGDERLARLVAGGNDRAFTALYERYHQPLYRYCRSIVRDETDAQDALQSTFAGALVALRRGQRSAPVRPWLFRIAHNEAISVLRRRGDTEELSEASAGSVASAEDQAGDRRRFALLVADLRELPERLRAALVMRELSGLSHAEIAIALDMSLGAAKQAIFEGRRGLAEFAEGRSMACDEIRRSVSDGDGRVLRGRRVRAHLRDCPSCAAFAAAIPGRRGELQALVPVLPAAASAAMLTRLIGSGSGHGAGGGAGAVAAGAAGKTAGATIAAKTLVGAAILATAVGVTSVTGILTPTHHRPATVREPRGRSAPVAAPSPVTPTVGPAAATHARGTARRRAASVRRTAASRRRGRTHNKSRRVTPGTSTVPRTQHHGRGTLQTLPSQAHGTPTRSHGGGHGHGASASAHGGGPPTPRPVRRRPSTASHRPVSPGRSGTARTPHTSAVGVSHGKAGSTVATPDRPSPSAQSAPSPPARSRTR